MPETNKQELVKVVTGTGKVHLAYAGAWKNGNVDPLCNYMSWRGDYWGQPWGLLADQNIAVTCKNCLKADNKNSLIGKLANLGNEMRATKTTLMKKFLELSKGCEFRKITCYYRSHEETRYAFKCTNPNLEDPSFNWGCGPGACPHIGHLTGAEWEYEIEQKPNKEEIKDYENSRRTKED